MLIVSRPLWQLMGIVVSASSQAVAMHPHKASGRHYTCLWYQVVERIQLNSSELRRTYDSQGKAYSSAERFFDFKWRKSSSSTACRHLSRSYREGGSQWMSVRRCDLDKSMTKGSIASSRIGSTRSHHATHFQSPMYPTQHHATITRHPTFDQSPETFIGF